MQGTLRDEDPAAAERGRGLSDRHRAETWHLADEPEAIQEALRLNRPRRPAQPVDRRQMLTQGAEVGVVTRIAGRLRALLDRVGPRAIVASQRELVKELAHDMPEVLAYANAPSHRRKGLGEPLPSRRVGDKPVRTCGQRLGHGEGW